MDPQEHNFAAKIARAFTYNKPLSILVVLAIVVAGVALFYATPKQYNPEIERPAFEVSVEYPGARAGEVERYVTKELVEKMRELGGVDEVTARSVDGGKSVATVFFHVGEGVQDAKVRLFTQMQENLDLRKGNIQSPQIKSINPDDVPILSFVFLSRSSSQNQIRHELVDVMNQLKQVPGVANLQIHGGEPRALSVVLDTSKMRARNVAVSDIRQALVASNIKHKHEEITDSERVIALETKGFIESPEDARDIIVRPGVYLSDVATVIDGYTEKDSFVQYYDADEHQESKSAVYLSVAKQAGANAPTVSDAVQNRLSELMEKQQYEEISYDTVRDDGEVASNEINSLGTNLLISIGIVGLVLLVFLSLRPAIVVMSAIPLTLFLVFVVGYFFGQTINRITLFALILSLGLLVDSATVVAENIYRHIEEGVRERKEAIVHAVDEVGVGLLISTITSVVVFIPMRFITGMMGPYMGPVAFFVPAALIMALLVAFVVTPFLSNMILTTGADGAAKEASSRGFFQPIISAYESFQRKVLYNKSSQNKILAGVGILLLIVLSFPIFQLVEFQMLPKADKQQYYVYLDTPERTGVTRTLASTQAVANEIKQNPHTESIQSFVGEAPIVNFSGLFRGVSQRYLANNATLKVNITPQDARSLQSPQIVSNVRERVTSSKNISDETTVRFVEIPPGPPVRSTFLTDIHGGDREGRNELAEQINQMAQETPGAVDVDTSVAATYPRILVDVDTQKALSYGVSAQSVAQTLDMLSGPSRVGQYHPYDQNEFAPIEVRTPRDQRDAPADYREVDIRSQNGNLVPLSSVTQHEYSRNVPVIYSDGLAPTTQVTAAVDQRSIVYVLIDVMQGFFDYAQKESAGEITSWGLYGLEYQASDGSVYDIDWGGEWELTLDNFRDLGIAMLIAFFAVYLILVAQYRSFKTPALLMATVPFGLLGILPGFAVLEGVSSVPLTATALIGFIALIGIVVNNAIIFLEYFTQLKSQEHMGEKEALIEAGKVRMRPIVLTSLTTVLATLTIAFDPVWSGLAWSVVFGLSLSAFMTLGIFPILYARFVAKD